MDSVKIAIKNRVPILISQPLSICENSDIKIDIDFDDEWDEYSEKTLRLVFNDKTYEDVIFTGNEVILPIVHNATNVNVGVFAGNLITSTPVQIGYVKSIRSFNAEHRPPRPDVYDQLMAQLNSKQPINAPTLITGNKTIVGGINEVSQKTDLKITNPTGGEVGQVLKKTADGEEWADESGGGTTDYNDLTNKPTINGVTLESGLSISDIGGASADDIPTKTSDLTNDSGFITESVNTLTNYYLKSNTYTKTEVGNLIHEVEVMIPFSTSDLENDSGFIDNTVSDLANYYSKSNTYTKTEVQSLIDAVKQFEYVVVSVLPTASASTMHKIYLVPSEEPKTANIKDEYITIDNGESAPVRYTWEQIGSTAIDLTGYATEIWVEAKGYKDENGVKAIVTKEYIESLLDYAEDGEF